MKLLKGKRGVCAGGHPYTVDAGRRAFEAGGNAIDAAVAAQLMACVAEPLLTGLGGGGLAMIKQGNQCRVLDFFSDRPGLGPTRPIAPLETVSVSFGVDVQSFSYGVASVAMPGMIQGLWELHRSGGKLPLTLLAGWAAEVADKGLEVSTGLSKSINALAPIIEKDPYLTARFFTQDAEGALRCVPPGHYYNIPELSETLMRWASGGPKELFSGSSLKNILATLGDFAPLSQRDIETYQTKWHEPLSKVIQTASCPIKISTPGLPSQGGVQILAIVEEMAARLEQYSQSTSKLEPFGATAAGMLAEVMHMLESKKDHTWPKQLIDQHPKTAEGQFWQSKLGFTTHLSTYDNEGNTVGITSSLGETAGVSVESMGLLLNNFMGEEDVAPPNCLPAPGQRLFTMCSPSLLEIDHPHLGTQGYMLGSGGSSRIRSIIAQGILYLAPDLLPIGEDLSKVVEAPRVHYEDRKLRVELFERPENVKTALAETCRSKGDELICFDDFNLFFGGLHLASGGVHGLGGAGDPRRSGSIAIV